jgi:hypothetical protein
VGVHRPTEDQRGVVAARIGGRIGLLRDCPDVELVAAPREFLAEDAGSRVALMDDRKRAHWFKSRLSVLRAGARGARLA